MKRSFKKIISVILTVLFVFSAVGTAFTAFAADKTCDCDKIPVIYVTGRQTIYNDPASPDKYEVPNDTTEKIIEVAKPCIKELSKALLTDQWDTYCDTLVDAVLPFYAEYKLNPDGTKACPTSGTASNPWGGYQFPIITRAMI